MAVYTSHSSIDLPARLACIKLFINNVLLHYFCSTCSPAHALNITLTDSKLTINVSLTNKLMNEYCLSVIIYCLNILTDSSYKK